MTTQSNKPQTNVSDEAINRRLEEILSELQSLSCQWDEALLTGSGRCREISDQYVALQRESCLLRSKLSNSNP